MINDNPTYEYMQDQVADSFGDFRQDIETSDVVDEIIRQYGRIDIQKIDPTEYWAIVVPLMEGG